MVAPALRFLVADPLDGVQVFVRRLLEGYGFDPQRIHCCAGSNEALQVGLAQAPDFLLTDWFGGASPTGLQLVEQLRARNRELRVGFLSFQVTPFRVTVLPTPTFRVSNVAPVLLKPTVSPASIPVSVPALLITAAVLPL